MKHMMRKGLAFLLAFLLCAGMIPGQAADLAQTSAAVQTPAAVQPQTSSEPAADEAPAGSGFVAEQFYDFSTQGTATADAALPDTYQSPYVTSVKDQGSNNNCWAFALVGAVESSALKTGVATAPDYSEWGVTYFTYYSSKGMGGGDYVLGARRLSQWVGPVDQSQLPTSGSSISSSYATAYDSAHLEDFYVVDKGDIDGVKQLIMDRGGVASNYKTGGGLARQSDGSYAYYGSKSYLETHGSGNHAIEYVGWDDNFSRLNFSSVCRPEHDGAWLVKNSWGSNWGKNGYFWMSYEQVDDTYSNATVAVKMGKKDNYDSIYYYGYNTDIVTEQGGTYSSAGNVFTAKGTELLQAVGIETTAAMTDYTVKLYKNLTGSTPGSGVLTETLTGTQTYVGYETLELPTPLLLSPGETFCITVEQKAPDGSIITPILDSEDGGIIDNNGYGCKNGVWIKLSGEYAPAKAYTNKTTAQTCKVTFDACGGSVSPASRTATQKDIYGTLPTPTRSGYTFWGWRTAKDGGGAAVAANTVVTATADHTLYASWVETSKLCTVTLDANGGSSAEKSLSAIQGDTYGTLPVPTRDGYSFTGWYLEKAYSTAAVTENSTVPAQGTLTLYAHWEAMIAHTLYFNACGGVVDPGSKVVYSGDAYGALPEPTKVGYTFRGWYTEPDKGGTKITYFCQVDLRRDQTLYAAWDGEMAVTLLDYNDGTGRVDMAFFCIAGRPYNATFGDLPTPTRSGYSFAGWYTQRTGGKLVTPNTVNTEADCANNELTLYAHWAQTPVSIYEVKFDENGGYLLVDNTVIPATSAAPRITLPTPSWNGHTFQGWYTSASGGTRVGGAGDTYEATGSRTLYAQWQENGSPDYFDENGDGIPDEFQVKFTFQATGDAKLSSAMPTTLAQQGTTEDLTKSPAVGTWKQDADGSVTVWKNKGNKTYSAYYGARSNWFSTTYYPIICGWSASLYPAEVPQVDSRCQWVQDDNRSPLTAGNGMNTPSDVQNGPGADAKAGTTDRVDYAVGPAAGDIRFAVAETGPATYSVTYHSNLPAGATGTADTIQAKLDQLAGDPVKEDSAAAGVASPVRAGYTYAFAGWYTAAEGGDRVTSVTGPQTLYAHWTQTSVKISVVPDKGRDYLVLRGVWRNEGTKALQVQDADGAVLPSQDVTWRIVPGSAETYGFAEDCVALTEDGNLTVKKSGICEVEANHGGETAKIVVVVPGDYNRDGKLNTADATIAIDVSVEDAVLEERPYALALLDMNLDGKINTADATAMVDLAVGDYTIAETA